MMVFIFRLSLISIKLAKLRNLDNFKLIFNSIALLIIVNHKITNDIFSYGLNGKQTQYYSQI